MGVALKPLYDSISEVLYKFCTGRGLGYLEIVAVEMWQLTIERSIFVRCAGINQNVARGVSVFLPV